MKKTPLILFLLLPLILLGQTKPVVKSETVPGSSVSYRMALIPGGKFLMGSAETETGRGTDEGLHEVTLDSFWIGVCEVTFDEFVLTRMPQLHPVSAPTPWLALLRHITTLLMEEARPVVIRLQR
jgi:hypothetical protein